MRRLAALTLVAVVAVVVVVSSAQAALFFLFKPTTADAADRVTVRLGGTPASFTLEKREKPFRRPIRLYLVPDDVAGEVSSRFDRRLHFVGALYPDKNGRGILSFTVPPLETGAYALAYWCPACATYSRGVTFGVQTVPQVSRYRHLMGLRIEMPSATETCPVSGEGPYGNGLLSTTLPRDGVLTARKDRGGTLFAKPLWLPHRQFPNTLQVRGERLDVPSPPLRVLSVNWGHLIVGGRQRGSWASAVEFPSEGCWRLTGRVRDISLSYVVKVVAAP